jgi:hypothetical protein
MDPAVAAELEGLAPAIEAELRGNLAQIPNDKKIVLSRDIIGVKGPCDPHDLSSEVWLGLHHIPSGTVFGIDPDGVVTGVEVRGQPASREDARGDGVAALNQVVADEAIMDRILEFLAK